jgi:hypothetical protein
MNEIIIYKVEREDGLDPLYGAVVAYDPENGACFYAVSTPDGAPVVYNFTDVAGSVRIDVDYYTDHGLGTKEIYHTVTYRDDDGTFLSDQEVRSGKNAIPPSPPRKNGITGQWNHTGEFIEQDTDIFADYTGGDVFKPERPEDYYSSGQQVFLRDDYNQKVDRFLENRGMSPTAVENMVVGHTFEDIQVQYGLWDKQKMQLKELGTYGEIKSGTYFFDDFIELLEYLCETYSFNMNDIVCYDSGMAINGRTRHCVVMGYDYEYSAVAIAYGIGDIQLHLYSPDDLRDKYIDITFDIDILSGHATRPTHTVKYVTESGSPIQTVMIQHGKNVRTSAIPEVPEKDGYAGVWSHDGAGITGDTTIYPVYTRIGDELEDNGPYAVSFYMPAWIVNLRKEDPVTDENGKEQICQAVASPVEGEDAVEWTVTFTATESGTHTYTVAGAYANGYVDSSKTATFTVTVEAPPVVEPPAETEPDDEPVTKPGGSSGSSNVVSFTEVLTMLYNKIIEAINYIMVILKSLF